VVVPRPAGRALGLAVATGSGYGLTAALLKLVILQLQDGWSEPLRHPALYAACIVGPAAILLSRNTLQQGRLATPAVTIILLADPLVGLAAGVTWFGDHITTALPALSGAVLGVGTAITGIAIAQSGSHRTAPPPAPTSPATAQEAGTVMTTNAHRRLVSEQPLGTFYRRTATGFAALLIGLGGTGLLALHILTRPSRLAAQIGWSDPLSVLSVLSILAGIVLIAAARRGGASASTALTATGGLVLGSGLAHLTVHITTVGSAAFRYPSGALCVLLGTALLITGCYGRFTGNLPADNPWRSSGSWAAPSCSPPSTGQPRGRHRRDRRPDLRRAAAPQRLDLARRRRPRRQQPHRHRTRHPHHGHQLTRAGLSIRPVVDRRTGRAQSEHRRAT